MLEERQWHNEWDEVWDDGDYDYEEEYDVSSCCKYDIGDDDENAEAV